MSEKLRERLNELRVTSARTPKIAATIKKRAMDAEVAAKKITDWINRRLKEVDDMDSRDAMKIMNVSSQLKEIADKISK